MPTGPKGEKRPADVIGNAVKVMRIATGEEEHAPPANQREGRARKSAERRCIMASGTFVQMTAIKKSRP
jgi:hypothetical protein